MIIIVGVVLLYIIILDHNKITIYNRHIINLYMVIIVYIIEYI